MRGDLASSGRQGCALWVSIDGVECAGKTSLCERLRMSTQTSHLLPEFSSTPVGLHLQSSVKLSPHFISSSMVGQSLLFLADYAEIAKAAAQIDDSEGRIIVQDRGLLSKLVYQLVVLRRSIGERRARKLPSAIIEELPKPDVTVLLDAPMSVIESRLALGRPGWITAERQAFVKEASAAFREELEKLQGVTLNLYQEPPDTADDTLSAVLTKMLSRPPKRTLPIL